MSVAGAPARPMGTGRWSGRVAFILASIGSAVGLGSIWKFPYEVGANGGGAFVFFYLLGLICVVAPLLLAEFAIGRRGRGDAVTAIAEVAHAGGASRLWSLVGVLGVFTGFLILSYYAVIGGWTLSHAWSAFAHGLDAATPAAAAAAFARELADSRGMMLAQAAFLAVTMLIVAGGVSGGIEAAAKVLMPLLVVMIVALAIHALAVGDAARAFRFFFAVDWRGVSPMIALKAFGLGFFSIGVGLGLMITYAAYAQPDTNLREAAAVTLVGDTAISFLAGFAIFPIVFLHGLDPASGPGLMFVTLPLAFARMPFGDTLATAFYGLLFVAALSSAIAILELVVAWLIGRCGLRRIPAVLVAGATCWLFGLATVLSFGPWRDWHPLAAIPAFAHATVFDLIDHLASNLLLPLGGLLLSIFAVTATSPHFLAEELGLSSGGARLLRFMLALVTPPAILAVTVLPAFR